MCRADELFVTARIWVDNYTRDRLIRSQWESLAKLHAGYAALILICWLASGNGVDLPEYVTALAEAGAQSLTRRIGISNFNIALTKQAINMAGCGEIATRPDLSAKPQTGCFPEGTGYITVISYMTLACDKVLKDRVLAQIADKCQTTVAQIALA